jgi:hypothetical protein
VAQLSGALCVSELTMPSLLHLFRWLQDNSFIALINGTAWTAAALEIVHYFSMFVLVGSMIVVDLCVLGLLGSGEKVASFADRLFPWMWAGLAFNVLSGFLMFAGSAVAYYRNDIFYDKLIVVLLAVAASVVVHVKARALDQSPPVPLGAKVIALVSIGLWVAAIIAGVEVPALTGVG